MTARKSASPPKPPDSTKFGLTPEDLQRLQSGELSEKGLRLKWTDPRVRNERKKFREYLALASAFSLNAILYAIITCFFSALAGVFLSLPIALIALCAGISISDETAFLVPWLILWPPMLFAGFMGALDELYRYKPLSPSETDLLSRYESYKKTGKQYERAKDRYTKQLFASRVKTPEHWQQMDGHAFERNFCDLLTKLGYSATVTSGSGDEGIDIYANKDGRRIAIQCKRWKGTCPPAVVRELNGAKKPREEGWVVCTGGFSARTKRYAEQRNIRVLGMQEIITLAGKAYSEEAPEDGEEAHS